MKIIVDGVDVWYNSIQALKNISFEILSDETTFVIGPNGAGKSTLLKTIASIVKPIKGTVYIDGKNIAKLSPRDIGKIVSYVDPYISKSIPSTVLEFLLTARYPHQKTFSFSMPSQDLKIIDKIVKQLDIEHFLERRLDQLSSGELQRVLIARALIQKPKVLLLDEPSAFLDIRYRLEVLEHIKTITKENIITCIVAIHDLYLASLYADKVILMDKGQIVAAGDPATVFRKELLEEVYKVKISIAKIDNRDVVIPMKPLTLHSLKY
jgi:iron complex transport system ATP-binding protein